MLAVNLDCTTGVIILCMGTSRNLGLALTLATRWMWAVQRRVRLLSVVQFFCARILLQIYSNMHALTDCGVRWRLLLPRVGVARKARYSDRSCPYVCLFVTSRGRSIAR